MTTPSAHHLTKLLNGVACGEVSAHEELWSVIYSELHDIAELQMRDESPGRTLQSTALVHEAYLRLIGHGAVTWVNRRHFYSTAAEAMRHIRIDYARKRKSLKRSGSRQRIPLVEGLLLSK